MDPIEARSMTLVRDLVHGRWKAQAMRTTLDLGIPERLATQPKTVQQLAAELAVDADGLRRLMRLMIALGLFTEDDDGRLANNDASALLLADHPASQRLDASHTLSRSMGICWDNLEYAVRHGTSGFEHATGRSMFDYLRERPDEAAVTHAFQAGATRWNVPGLLAAGLLPETGTIVDVGGGNGTTLVEILRQRPKLRGILCDLPEVVQHARTVVAEAGQTDRVELYPSDFFADVPTGGDLYLLSHVLHDWSDDKALDIARQVAKAMDEHAELLVVELAKQPDGDDWVMAYLDLLVLVGLGGRERTAAEYAELLRRAGFEVARQQPIGLGGFPVHATLARLRLTQ